MTKKTPSEPLPLPLTDTEASATPMRIIVRRGALRRFHTLSQKASGLPVVVEWDRRQAHRREAPGEPGTERRQSDRRQAPPFTWEMADFVVAPPEGGVPADGDVAPAVTPEWHQLEHAFGAAGDLPALLAAAARDQRPGHDEQSTWFTLWSALCHQGDAYSASVAAVPYLIDMAPQQLALQQYDALLLAASIELARLEGRAPAVPEPLQPAYAAAVQAGRTMAEQLLPEAWDADAELALRGSAAVFRGDLTTARTIFGDD